MKINIYYGGRGVLDDPTLYVIEKMEKVLTELRVEIHRYNIYEYKNAISTLPQTMKGVDGVILATTVEWLGIGGFMNQFLDACWLYGDKDLMGSLYMQPVVMSTTYGEREGMLTLENAWEILGGLPCSGLCGYVTDLTSFQESSDYAHIIEKKAEALYRTISQKSKSLPTSNMAVKKTVLHSQQLQLTPQESEQLSQFVSDDNYVRQQKMDIEELSSMYRDLLGEPETGMGQEDLEYISSFRSHYKPQKDFSASYLFQIEGRKKSLYIHVTPSDITCAYESKDEVNVLAKMSSKVMDDIVAGRETFQRAFGVGDMTAKGNLRTLNMLDVIFPFS